MNEKKVKCDIWAIIFPIMAIVGLFTLTCIYKYRLDELKIEAVKVGHAKWSTSDRGTTSFEWLATDTSNVSIIFNVDDEIDKLYGKQIDTLCNDIEQYGGKVILNGGR